MAELCGSYISGQVAEVRQNVWHCILEYEDLSVPVDIFFVVA